MNYFFPQRNPLLAPTHNSYMPSVNTLRAQALYGPQLYRTRTLEMNASDERGIQVMFDCTHTYRSRTVIPRSAVRRCIAKRVSTYMGTPSVSSRLLVSLYFRSLRTSTCSCAFILLHVHARAHVHMHFQVVREKVKTFAQASVGTATTPGYPCPQFKVRTWGQP